MSTEQQRITELEAENASLREKLHREEQRCAQLLADGDRREQRALNQLPDCDAHRSEIQYLRHLASWYHDREQQADTARKAMATSLVVTSQRLEGRTDPVPAPDLVKWLRDAARANLNILHGRRKRYPNLADCARAGGCDHDGISDDLKTDIARVLGLGPEHCKETPADGPIL